MGNIDFLVKDSNYYKVQFDLLQNIKYEVGARHQDQNQNFPKHTHDYIEFVFMFKGRSVQIINDEKIFLKQNEMLMIPKGDFHENVKCTSEDIVLNIFITNNFLNSLIVKSGFENKLINFKYLLDNNTLSNTFNFSGQKEILDLLNKINNYITNNEQFYLKLYNLILGWFIEFVLYLNEQDIIKDEIYSTFDLMPYIINNLKTASLKEFADLNYRSSSAMSLKIKNEYKMSFMEIVHKVRLEKFIELVSIDKLSITEAMFLVGYQNKTYFYKIFRNQYKMTPHDFITKYSNGTK